MRRNIAALMLGLALAFSGCAWADGYPDQPIRKSVRKVTVPRPARRKKAAVKKAPAPKPAAKPVVTALQQGIALAEQERYGAAQPLLRKAIMENRHSAEAWYWYGVCHEKTGRFYEAQYFYSKAVECDPAFEPLSRVVAWPGNGEKTPVWDPKRPARVYPVSTGSSGVTIVPPDSPQARTRPTRPQVDPKLPKVPVYVPPEPGSSPMDGDAWRPSVYVPPTMSEAALETEEGDFPAYIPPESPKGLSAASAGTVTPNAAPAYQPPAPTPTLAPAQPSQRPQPAAALSRPASPQTQQSVTPAYQPPSRPKAQPQTAVQPVESPETQRQEVKPAAPRKIVKQSAKKPEKKTSSTPAKKPTKKAGPKPAAKPAQPTAPAQPKAQPQSPKQAAPTIREEELPPTAEQQPKVPYPPRVEELPPVGHGMPEGTVEAPSMPPVAQNKEAD